MNSITQREGRLRTETQQNEVMNRRDGSGTTRGFVEGSQRSLIDSVTLTHHSFSSVVSISSDVPVNALSDSIELREIRDQVEQLRWVVLKMKSSDSELTPNPLKDFSLSFMPRYNFESSSREYQSRCSIELRYNPILLTISTFPWAIIVFLCCCFMTVVFGETFKLKALSNEIAQIICLCHFIFSLGACGYVRRSFIRKQIEQSIEQIVVNTVDGERGESKLGLT